MSHLKRFLQVLLGVFTGIASLVVMFVVGLLAVGALIVTSIAVVLRIKWLQRKFEKQSPHSNSDSDAANEKYQDISAAKTSEGAYRVSGT